MYMIAAATAHTNSHSTIFCSNKRSVRNNIIDVNMLDYKLSMTHTTACNHTLSSIIHSVMMEVFPCLIYSLHAQWGCVHTCICMSTSIAGNCNLFVICVHSIMDSHLLMAYAILCVPSLTF